MDLSELLDYSQRCSTPTIFEQAFEFNESTQGQQTVASSNDPINILSVCQALAPSEDTIRSYLINEDNFLLSASCMSDNACSAINQEMSNGFHAEGTTQNLFDVKAQQSNFDSTSTFNNNTDTFLSLPTLSYYNNDHHQTYQRQLTEEYARRKASFMYLLKLGYKLVIKLNTKNSLTFEPWNQIVAQKLLSVHFTPLSLQTEYLSNQLSLDQFETLVLDEATAAFKVAKGFKMGSSLIDKIADPTSAHLNSICNKIKGFRKLVNCDKISLLINGFYEMNLMKGIVGYNRLTDVWQSSETNFKYDRRDVFLFSQSLHNDFVHIIETFPDKWRNDQKVLALINLIIIFNCELRGLKHIESIRHEQYVYIYLLERYLKSISQSTCEASDDHYRIMIKIQQVRGMREFLKQLIDTVSLGYSNSLRFFITKAVNGKIL